MRLKFCTPDLFAVGSHPLDRLFLKGTVQQQMQGKQQWDGFHTLLFISRLLKLRTGLIYYPPPVHTLNLLPNEVCLQIFIRFHALLAQSVNCKTTVPQNAITVISALIIVKHCYPETKTKGRKNYCYI